MTVEVVDDDPGTPVLTLTFTSYVLESTGGVRVLLGPLGFDAYVGVRQRFISNDMSGGFTAGIAIGARF